MSHIKRSRCVAHQVELGNGQYGELITTVPRNGTGEIRRFKAYGTRRSRWGCLPDLQSIRSTGGAQG